MRARRHDAVSALLRRCRQVRPGKSDFTCYCAEMSVVPRLILVAALLGGCSGATTTAEPSATSPGVGQESFVPETGSPTGDITATPSAAVTKTPSDPPASIPPTPEPTQRPRATNRATPSPSPAADWGITGSVPASAAVGTDLVFTGAVTGTPPAGIAPIDLRCELAIIYPGILHERAVAMEPSIQTRDFQVVLPLSPYASTGSVPWTLDCFPTAPGSRGTSGTTELTN